MLGSLICSLSFDPKKEKIPVEFRGSVDITYPIIGFPMLKDFNPMIDCESHQTSNLRTGGVVQCSSVTTGKNRKSRAGGLRVVVVRRKKKEVEGLF